MGRHRRPGRPKGSKDTKPRKRRTKLGMAVSRSRNLDETEFRRLRGRPKKNVIIHHKGKIIKYNNVNVIIEK